jgi:hypothetical protein
VNEKKRGCPSHGCVCRGQDFFAWKKRIDFSIRRFAVANADCAGLRDQSMTTRAKADMMLKTLCVLYRYQFIFGAIGKEQFDQSMLNAEDTACIIVSSKSFRQFFGDNENN